MFIILVTPLKNIQATPHHIIKISKLITQIRTSGFGLFFKKYCKLKIFYDKICLPYQLNIKAGAIFFILYNNLKMWKFYRFKGENLW